MEGLERAHACVYGTGIIVDVGGPALGDVGGSGVERVVSLVVEGDGLEGVFGLLDMRAGPDAIILEEL